VDDLKEGVAARSKVLNHAGCNNLRLTERLINEFKTNFHAVLQPWSQFCAKMQPS
jgi:hypothetical protein